MGVAPAVAAGPDTTKDESGPPGVSAAWLAEVQQSILDAEYHITWQSQIPLQGVRDAWHAPNRAHGFRTYFTEGGIHLAPRTELGPSWEWGLSLIGYGRGAEVRSIAPAILSAGENRIEYLREEVTEWYVNDRKGLEQGFTLFAPPDEIAMPGAEDKVSTSVPGARRPGLDGMGKHSPIYLVLALGGALSPVISADGQAIDFETSDGERVLRYSQLKVHDARGEEVQAHLEGFADSGVRGIRIVMDDQAATYPITVDPLTTSPVWIMKAAQQYANLGKSVATAGDVNGDGYSDVIIGAPGYDNGHSAEGHVFVFYGSVVGLGSGPLAEPPTADWFAESNQANANLGSAVATAGDVNSDGYSDIIVGASNYSNGESFEGGIFVYHGSATGLDLLHTRPRGTRANADWIAEGEQSSAAFGTSVSTAGDVNGDGCSDVIVGATYYEDAEPGADGGWAFVYHGSSTGLDLGGMRPAGTPANADWSATENQADAYYGQSVSTAGDVNGDGYTDVIVGAENYSNVETEEGHAFVYHGSSSGLSTSADWTGEGDLAHGHFGNSVSTAGDVDGDGYADVIVGAFGSSNPEFGEGKVLVYHGSGTGLSGGPNAGPLDADWTAEGNQDTVNLGTQVATAGDVNGDGFADVIIGAWRYENGQTDEGGAFVYYGSATGLDLNGTRPSGEPANADWSAEGNEDNSCFGCAVATAGDVDGDGYAEVIVGAPNAQHLFEHTDEGLAFVFRGSAAGLASAAGWAVDGTQEGAQLGLSASTAGDVNGDGYADVIVGARLYDNGFTDEGQAWLYLGAAAGLSTSAGWSASGGQANAQFGRRVAGAGDVNNDGYSDFIVGAHQYDGPHAPDDGAAFLYHGSATALSTSPDWTATGEAANDWFGSDVATAGDVNGDGYSDVLVAATAWGAGNWGRAYLYCGSATGLSSGYAWRMQTDNVQAGVTYASTAGDVDGDGYSDVIIGSTGYDCGNTNTGGAWVYLGAAAGLGPNGTVFNADWSSYGTQYTERRGITAAAGDVNGDGYADVIVGGSAYNGAAGAEAGKVDVYHGSAVGLTTTPTWTVEGETAGDRFGIKVSGAGDVNGDGYADVLVGAHLFDVTLDGEEGRAYLYLGSTAGLSLTSNWTVDGSALLEHLGQLVAGAGDVNGDGYADALVGSPTYDAAVDAEGRCQLFYGDGGPGLSLKPEQRRSDDSAPIANLGVSDQLGEFRLALLGRTPFGRGNVQLEWETEPLGTLFNGFSTKVGVHPFDTGTAGVALSELESGLLDETVYHWRVRLRYDPVTTPFAQHSRWLTIPWNGWQEADLRMGQRLAIGDWVWVDINRDGIQDLGETGLADVLVTLFDGDGWPMGSTLTDADGNYGFAGLVPGQYGLRFAPPPGYSLSPQDQGGDDTLDSDADPSTGDTDVFLLSGSADASDWDAGMIPCVVPDEYVYIYQVTLSTDGNDYPILHYMDANQLFQVTGYNIYRSGDPGLPHGSWTLLGSDVTDMDAGTPNHQYVDSTGDPPPGTIWYYEVAAYNNGCLAEGPW